jgi:hypothetical protein
MLTAAFRGSTQASLGNPAIKFFHSVQWLYAALAIHLDQAGSQLHFPMPSHLVAQPSYLLRLKIVAINGIVNGKI